MTSVDVLGVSVAAVAAEDLLNQVVRWASAPQLAQRTILYANVHVLNTAYWNQALFEELGSASLVYCDGSGVRLGAWLLGSRLPARLTGADWIDPLCERVRREGLSMFLLGGAPGVAARAAETLVHRHPGLRIAGSHHGYGAPEDAEPVLAMINRSSAHILLVGMGTPRQELWIRRHRQGLRPPIVWAVGALFDFVAGLEQRGPSWMLKWHLEWMARLYGNPRRLWRRYLIGNPRFVALVLRQRLLGLPQRLTRMHPRHEQE